jgi:hypothetical protein
MKNPAHNNNYWRLSVLLPDGKLRYREYPRILVLLFIFWLSFSAVSAQTTSITQLTFPLGALAGSLEPIPVGVTVLYNDAKPGYWLVVGITDPQLNNTVIEGTAEAYPNLCVNQPIVRAVCQVQTQSGSGVETVHFKIGGIFTSVQRGPGTWNLQIVAELLDANRTVLTRSDEHFAISLATVSLAIDVPSNVTVWVDGVATAGGSIPIALGQHSLSIPMYVAINETDRLHFDHWSDGVMEPNRTVYVSSNAELSAFYHTQHRLVVDGAGANASGAGWYDDSSIANFTLLQTQLPAGPLSLLGARITFQGWFENGKLITSSPSGMIEMDHSHSITAEWMTDYTIPMIFFVLVAVGAGLGVFLAIRRSTRKVKRRTSPRRRRTVSRQVGVRRTTKRR